MINMFVLVLSLLSILCDYCIAQDIRPAYQLETMVVKEKQGDVSRANGVYLGINEGLKGVLPRVQDVLEKSSGIDVQTRSILTPKSTSIRIRGLDERRSLVVVDGTPLNGAGVMGGYFVDWSLFDPHSYGQVMINKGGFSAEYGNTLGGVIEFIPQAISNRISLWGGYQSYNTHIVGASISRKWSRVGIRLMADTFETDGYLRNSGAKRKGFSSSFYYFIGEGEDIHFTLRYVDGKFFMPVENLKTGGRAGYDSSYPESFGSYLIGPGIRFKRGDTQGDGSFYTKSRLETELSMKKKINQWDSEWKLYYNTEHRKDHIYSYDLDELLIKRECDPDRTWGWLSKWSRNFGNHRLGAGIEGNYQGYGGTHYIYVMPNYFRFPPEDGKDQWNVRKYHGFYVQDNWYATEKLMVYVGIRYDDFRMDKREVDQVISYRPFQFGKKEVSFHEHSILPKLGVLYRPISHLSLYAKVARAVRYPDLPAFYWYYAGYRPEIDPSSGIIRPPLSSEDALQSEFGVVYSNTRFKLGLNYYYYVIKDYIRWIFGYRPSRVVYNIDRVRIYGVEADLEGKITDFLSGYFNVSWQKTKKYNDVFDGSNHLTDELSELPDWKINAGIYARIKRLTGELRVKWCGTREVPYLEGATYSSPSGVPSGSAVTLKKLDDYLNVDLTAKYRIWGEGKRSGYIKVGVNNLFDEYYEEEYGFPALDRTYFAEVEFSF